MSDTTTDAVEQGTATEVETDATSGAADASFSERYSEILAKVNGTSGCAMHNASRSCRSLRPYSALCV